MQPKKHELITFGKFSVEEILPLVNRKRAKLTVDGKTYDVEIDQERLKLRLFARSRVCVECGLVGIYFLLQQTSPSEQLSSRSRHGACYIERCTFYHPYEKRHGLHLNLYGVRPGTGNEVLMTKDHIFPKSKGGAGGLSNLQTMCEKCNRRKGDAT